jgi:hypothetical protein
MDLDGFLEKDMITYLENAINFDTKERQEMQSELDALLAEKDSPESPSLTQAKQKADSAAEDAAQSSAITSGTDAEAGATADALTSQSSESSDASELTEASDSSETSEATASDETAEATSTDAAPVEIQAQEVTVTTPSDSSQPDEPDSAQETKPEQDTAWIDELEEKTADQRSELEKLIRLEDTLNDLQHAIMQHEADKAHALYTHLQQETESIQHHPTEKQFLMDALARLAKELSTLDETTEESDDATTTDVATTTATNEDDVDLPDELTNDATALTDTSPLAEESSATYDEEEPVLSDAMQSVADQFLADTESEAETPPPFSIDPLDLPASFVQEETKAVVSYVEGVTALRNGDKTAALEIFLALAKKRPKNLAIKIRLQEAIELP